MIIDSKSKNKADKSVMIQNNLKILTAHVV